MATRNKYPTAALNEPDSSDLAVLSLMNTIRQKADSRPQNVEELKKRIDGYFSFCHDHELRPGVEGLSLALGISRQMFWRWCNNERGREWGDVCNSAKQALGAYLEAVSMNGKLNPATSIFLMKNWLGYKDSVELTATNDRQDLPDLSSVRERLPDIAEHRPGNNELDEFLDE